jgi:hypothetical protein
MSNEQLDPQEDESLGVEQLPQDELEASPGDNTQASKLDVEAAGAATMSVDPTKPQDSKNQSSEADE